MSWKKINSNLQDVLETDDIYNYKMMDCGSEEDLCFYNCVCKALESHDKFNSLFPIFLQQMVEDEISSSAFYQAFKEESKTGVGHLEMLISSKILNCIFTIYVETENGIQIEKIWDKENVNTPEFSIELYLEEFSSHFYLLGKKKQSQRRGRFETYFSFLI